MEHTNQTAIPAVLSQINAVEGFDPEKFAVAYTDLNTGETRMRLPVMIQMAWFRLKYPEGRLAVQVRSEKDFFVASAKVYRHYQDADNQYLAEATASRTYAQDKPNVSPREWAQTAAVGIALRNAGFGLQFHAAGDSFDDPAVNELEMSTDDSVEPHSSGMEQSEQAAPEPLPERELTPEERLEQAKQIPCPIAKLQGKKLGELITQDPNALIWLATKFKGDDTVIAAAKLICEYAQQSA